MYYNRIIRENLRRLGRQVVVHCDDRETTVRAVVESKRRKTKTLFEDSSGKPGRYYDDYYTYIGPADTDITALGEDDWVAFGGHRYAVIQSEGIVAAGEIVYYEAILKRIWEEEDVFQ